MLSRCPSTWQHRCRRRESGRLPVRQPFRALLPLSESPLAALHLTPRIGWRTSSRGVSQVPRTYDYDLVCIGSGPAGQRAAVQSAKLGKCVAVVEKQQCLGGVCLGTGTIPSKTLREAVLFFTRVAGRYDRARAAPPDARPTAEQLLAKVDEVLGREQDVIEDQLRRNDVTVVRGEASFVDAHTLVVRQEDQWRRISAENIVIAVGTQPAPPPGVAADGEVVITGDDVVGLKQIPRAMAVVGGSVIGIEYASMFSALGVPVTLIEKRQRPLEFLDREIVEELIHQMRHRNVTGYPTRGAASSEQGRLAACHAFGIEAGPMAAHFPIGIYAIPEISMVGAPEHELTERKVPYETGVARYREIARGQILGDDSGLFKMLFHREDRRLLGVHVIGTGATELVHIGQAVLGLGGGIDYFLQTVFNYPTLAECYKVAALDASNKLRG